MANKLYYGDNLEVLRKYIKDETIDLCYIDPPFNSKRNYNQIYNNVGKEDQAQAQAFIDIWTWDDHANQGLSEILGNYHGNFTVQSIKLISGLTEVLGKGSLLAYLVSMTLRIAEIFRVLKNTGSFYLHCDQSSSHYLKLVLDAIFCPQGGDFKNEIIWIRSNPKSNISVNFPNCTDTILRYTKSGKYLFHQPYGEHNKDYVSSAYKYSDEKGKYRLLPLLNPNDNRPNLTYEFLGVTRVWRWTKERMQKSYDEGLVVQLKPGSVPQYKKYLSDSKGRTITNHWSDIPQTAGNESLGYPTQKPEALLERIINASSNEGDVILDAYCGCGTTVAVAENLNRQWIGIDITYQSISLILKRLEDKFGQGLLENIQLNGIPRDAESAIALANKKDDRTRKEFEKWAVLTYTNNRAVINLKKGSDKGIDGVVYFRSEKNDTEKVIFQVKSGKVKSGDIWDLQGTMTLQGAEIGVFITLQEPTKDMIKTAKSAGIYQNKFMSQSYDKISIVTIQEIITEKKRFNLTLIHEVLKSAEKVKETNSNQLGLFE